MSETKLLKTDSPSKDGEPVSEKPNRILTWLGDNRWYIAGTLVVLMIARSEAKRAETPEMRKNRQVIEEMSRAERNRLRHNQEQFENLSRKGVQRVQRIHDAAQNNQRLDKTIAEFHSWLATLSLGEREELLATVNVEDRLQIIRRVKTKAASPPSQQESKPALDMATRTQFANLQVSLHDYERMMIAGAKWLNLPSESANKTASGQLEYHSSVLAAILDEILPGWRTTMSRTGNRPRPMFPDKLRKALLAKLSDPNIRQAISGRTVNIQNMMVMTLLVRGLFNETRRVAVFLKPTDEELDRVFKSLPDDRRKGIAGMPKELGDRFLQQVWVTRRLSPKAEESLSRIWGTFDKLLNRHPNGTNPPRPRFSGRDFRPNGK